MRRKFIGKVASAMGAIPVERPQDVKFPGAGQVSLEGTTVKGDGETKFLSQLTEGATIMIGEINGVVASIESESEATLKKPLKESLPMQKYKIIPKLDQEAVFETVANALLEGKAIGIFPEGGSHDRSDLLPLKAGVTIMALQALEKNPNLDLRIIPCGLNYFHGHKFRSQVYIYIYMHISLTPSLPHSLTHSLNHSLTHSLNQSLTHTINHSLTGNVRYWRTYKSITRDIQKI